MASLRESLEANREGYVKECEWHRFLLDSLLLIAPKLLGLLSLSPKNLLALCP